MDMQLHKLEFEIKLQKLTKELQELKSVSSAGRSSDPAMYHSPLERAISQACREGQDISDLLAFPVFEIIDQQNIDNIIPWSSKR